nr:hypothetical protein [Micromonospora sp. DSM 115978]
LRLAVVAAGLVAVVAALGGAVVMGADDTDTRITGTDTAAAGANPATTAALPATAGTDPGLVSTDSSPAPAPPGWVTYQDPTGWSISYPADWTRRPRGNPGNVDFENPRTGALLRIGTVDVANPSALADWLAHEQSFQDSEDDYRRIRLEPSDGATGAEQADWEFTYTLRGETVHVLDRGVIRNGHGYALYWRTTQQRWSDDEPLMWRLFSTFRPGL